MREIHRLIHNQNNILTSVNGFIELALDEPDRSKRYEYMRRAQKEIRRAVEVAKDMRIQIEAKASIYGEKLDD